MIVEWFTPPRPQLEWFGPDQRTLALVQERGMGSVASIIGPRGPRGLSGGEASTFTFDQLESAMVWTINHNLGHEPLIAIVDSNGDEVECDIRHPTVNRTTAVFSKAITGRARLY